VRASNTAYRASLLHLNVNWQSARPRIRSGGLKRIMLWASRMPGHLSVRVRIPEPVSVKEGDLIFRHEMEISNV
jgi:hypothetical protein